MTEAMSSGKRTDLRGSKSLGGCGEWVRRVGAESGCGEWVQRVGAEGRGLARRAHAEGSAMAEGIAMATIGG